MATELAARSLQPAHHATAGQRRSLPVQLCCSCPDSSPRWTLSNLTWSLLHSGVMSCCCQGPFPLATSPAPTLPNPISAPAPTALGALASVSQGQVRPPPLLLAGHPVPFVHALLLVTKELSPGPAFLAHLGQAGGLPLPSLTNPTVGRSFSLCGGLEHGHSLCTPAPCFFPST